MDNTDREAESAEIERRYDQYLAPRNGATEHKYSPEYMNSRPKSALEALRITPEQQELVIFHYASTSSIPKTCALTGLGSDKVRAIIFNPSSTPIIDEYRTKMRVSILGEIEKTQVDLLEAVRDQNKLKNATLREISLVFSEITTSQVSMMTASREVASGGFGNSVDPTKIFSGEEMEVMALLRRKLDVGSTHVLSARETSDPMSGHDLVDTSFSLSPDAVDPGYEAIPTIISREYDPFAEQNDEDEG